MTASTDPSPKPRRRPPTWHQRLLQAVMIRATILLVWVLRLTCRIEVVHGAAHVDTLRRARQPFVPCGWHQRIIVSALYLRSLVGSGIRLGFLISPSREGEFIARVASAHGTTPIRGSSSRTGRQAMIDLRAAVGRGISPMMYGDGPRGPAGVFKPGAAVLSSRSGAPLLAIGCAASRYWQLRSWDRGQIPKPFARITIAIGEPWTVGPLVEPAQAEAIAVEIGERLDRLDRIAADAQRR